MENTNEWIGWMEEEDLETDVLDAVELSRLRRLAEEPELANFHLGMLRANERVYPGGPQ